MDYDVLVSCWFCLRGSYNYQDTWSLFQVQLTLQPSREEPVKGEELELPPDLLQAVAEDEEGDGGGEN